MEKEKLHVLNNNEPLSRKIVTTDLLDNLSSKPNNRVKYEPDYISLYDVLGFIDLDNANCQYEIEKLIDNCNDMLDISNISIIDTKFDFKNKCLVLSMLDGFDTTVWEIDVAIEGDKINIVRETLHYNEQFYSSIYEYLPKLYEWVKYNDFKKVGNGKYFNVRPENSQFLIDFNYNGSSTSTFVKTENSYYRMKVTNSEECSKYADVNCVYEMALDDKLTEEYDQILAYNGSTLITKYGKIFNVNN